VTEGIHAIAAHSIEWDEHQCGRADRVPRNYAASVAGQLPSAKFELVINLKMAKAIGLEICASVKTSLCNFDHHTNRCWRLSKDEIDDLY
jgi:hypothetical protein